MERRWTARAPIYLDVGLFFQGKEISVCKTRDIGLGGVFLESAQPLLPKEAQVELIFMLGSGAQRIKHKIRAKVARLAEEGMGLVFRDFDATAFRSLQEVMRHKESVETPH
ncbi:MAG: PilZ domain-containing protein [Gammaproteobacteria bacterium]|nr:PilZ domain-containing protein [Gammaproteobacteria bacterium]